MSTEFDAKKAIREEMTGLADVLRVLQAQERRAEEELGRAEVELNAARKLTGFARIELERKRSILQKLELEEQEQMGDSSGQ